MCKSRGGRPGLPVPNSPDGLYGHKATLNLRHKPEHTRSCVKVEVAVPNSPCGPCGRNATLNERTPRYFGRLTGDLEGEETAGRVSRLGP